ncbi:trypsin-like peptidase domain-containing protein [Sphingopyxis terrae]|uniref:Trypsin-like peptidase domain-containing protein n=1 Tax=Sphingopyxis terrae subsp. ummariensis TaxID=429001 RepID=A0A1Y6ENR5_9SPHN|nr:trypsin-like peptidase domain-containing protein [Sphingopyxis terrae]PCF92466.1 hypothetical protein CPA46_04950 [Sphingopyxis terrae subsp. ummariensis]SMQ64304.1 Trypsin-like peptidase domain-containing protein [Sphingopyxis terrae subsp. ummariensis]
MKEIIVSNVTLSTAMTLAFCDDIEISRSTGFIWSSDGQDFLITNWHCITGVNPLTGKSLSKTGARPNHLTMALATTQFGVKFALDLPLYDAEGEALWMVHPTAGEQVDVVAIPIQGEFRSTEETKRSLAKPFNELESKRHEAFVGDELMIVGFPRNLHIHGLPLFKRATFATEPNLYKDEPSFRHESSHRQVWVDCATRQGMSGSPVIHVKRSTILRPLGSPQEYDDLLDSYSFYGIYSGRVVDPDEDPRIDDQFAAQIGIVWPKPLIERIVKEGVRDRFRREDVFEKTIEGIPIAPRDIADRRDPGSSPG